SAHHHRTAETDSIAGDGAQILPSTGVDAVIAAELQDSLQLPVDRVVFIEEVLAAAGEGAELAAKHRLANVPVGPVAGAMSVEELLRPVIDARYAERHRIERQGGHYPFGLVLVSTKPGLVRSFADLVVIVEQGDHLVAEPGVGALSDEFGIAEQAEIVAGIAIAFRQELELVGYVVDAQRRIQAGDAERVEGEVPSAGDLG